MWPWESYLISLSFCPCIFKWGKITYKLFMESRENASETVSPMSAGPSTLITAVINLLCMHYLPFRKLCLPAFEKLSPRWHCQNPLCFLHCLSPHLSPVRTSESRQLTDGLAMVFKLRKPMALNLSRHTCLQERNVFSMSPQWNHSALRPMSL